MKIVVFALFVLVLLTGPLSAHQHERTQANPKPVHGDIVFFMYMAFADYQSYYETGDIGEYEFLHQIVEPDFIRIVIQSQVVVLDGNWEVLFDRKSKEILANSEIGVKNFLDQRGLQ